MRVLVGAIRYLETVYTVHRAKSAQVVIRVNGIYHWMTLMATAAACCMNILDLARAGSHGIYNDDKHEEKNVQ